MRIDPTALPTTTIRTPSSPITRSAEKAGESASAITESESFEPTSELARLLTAVREQPEVREDLVQSIAQRLLAGEFSTPASAGETATAMLAEHAG